MLLEINWPLTLAALTFSVGCAESPTDIRSVERDLRVPAARDPGAAAGAGTRTKEVLPEYAGTSVYHIVYLPMDWKPDKAYPIIVEYAGNGGYRNQFGDVSTGHVEDSKLGYGISAGNEFIWICLPYLNAAGTRNVTKWWGDAPDYDARPTVDYCKAAVRWICAKYGGDPGRVVLVGFSRGAIACNFIGLYDGEIAKIWRAFVAFSHYDGVVQRWSYPGCDRASALERLKRLGNRPQYICAETGSGAHSVGATQAYLQSTGIKGDFEFRHIGFRNHNDAWVLGPSKAREELRNWVRAVVGLKSDRD